MKITRFEEGFIPFGAVTKMIPLTAVTVPAVENASILAFEREKEIVETVLAVIVCVPSKIGLETSEITTL